MAAASEPTAGNAAERAVTEGHWASGLGGDQGEATQLEKTISSLLVLLPVIIRRMGAVSAPYPEGCHPTLAQKRVMVFIAIRDQVTISQIAEALDMSRPAASEMIDRMVEDGYVMRESNPADRRQVLITLTPRAAQVVHALTAKRREILIEALRDLDNAELCAFLKGMVGIAQVLAPDYTAELEAVSVE